MKNKQIKNSPARIASFVNGAVMNVVDYVEAVLIVLTNNL
jgi:hypothetical protein